MSIQSDETFQAFLEDMKRDPDQDLEVLLDRHYGQVELTPFGKELMRNLLLQVIERAQEREEHEEHE